MFLALEMCKKFNRNTFIKLYLKAMIFAEETK